MNHERLLRRLELDEGFRAKPYRDTVGKLTIGYGRNLDDRGVTPGEARYLLRRDVEQAVNDLDRHLPWWRDLDDVRQEVLANMAFNMGIGSATRGLLSFRNTLVYVRSGRYGEAAKGMLASRWARQVGARADRLAEAMRTGRFPEGAGSLS